MRRMAPRLVTILACGALMATQARAQDMDRRVSRFDLGVYAGGSLSGDWFESRTVTLNQTTTPTENDDAEGYSPGVGGAFGAQATFWFTPSFGIRAHGAYLPMRLPDNDDDEDNLGGDGGEYVMNTYVYDLNLALRPFASRGSPWLSSMYLFAGGGGLTVDVWGEDQPVCEGTLAGLGACLSFEPEDATVGQGTAGLGFDLIPLGSMLGLFAEAAVHVYDSPVHVSDTWLGPITAPAGSTVRIGNDATVVTGRLVLGLKAGFGNFVEEVAVAPPPPPPPPMAPPPPPPPPPVVVNTRDIRVCVVENGALREVTATYNTATGDTTVGGRPFASAYPATTGYAAGQAWFINSEPITVMGRRYVKFGLPRVLGAGEVSRVGDHMGVPVFAEAGATGTSEVIYLPVRPGCEFQPYQTEVKTGGVRGE
jgi:hypothetical protein